MLNQSKASSLTSYTFSISGFNGGQKYFFIYWPGRRYPYIVQAILNIWFTVSMSPKMWELISLSHHTFFLFAHFKVKLLDRRGHLSPRSISVYFGWYEILRFASDGLYFKEHIQNILLSILKKLLIVGSSAPPHLVFGILRFRTNIWHFITAFR